MAPPHEVRAEARWQHVSWQARSKPSLQPAAIFQDVHGASVARACCGSSLGATCVRRQLAHTTQGRSADLARCLGAVFRSSENLSTHSLARGIHCV
eukprot:15438596-Alexandrium_andersonii.AAC.1